MTYAKKSGGILFREDAANSRNQLRKRILLGREGANREKLTVKKIINNEIFVSPFMSLINREKLYVNGEKSAPKIHHFFTVSFSPFTSSWLGSDFGRTDSLRIFIFEPPDFFADFVAGFFSSFLWEKVPRKILSSPQQNPPKFIQQKSPTTFCRGAGPNSLRIIFSGVTYTLRNSTWMSLRSLQPLMTQNNSWGSNLLGNYVILL